MNQHGAVAVGGARQRADGEGVRVQRVNRMILGAVDVVPRGAVDDRVGPHAIHRRPHGGIVGDVERFARERRHVVARRAFVRHRGGELPARTHHRDSHVRLLSRR